MRTNSDNLEIQEAYLDGFASLMYNIDFGTNIHCPWDSFEENILYEAWQSGFRAAQKLILNSRY